MFKGQEGGDSNTFTLWEQKWNNLTHNVSNLLMDIYRMNKQNTLKNNTDRKLCFYYKIEFSVSVLRRIVLWAETYQQFENQ